MRNLLLKCAFSAALLAAALVLFPPFAGTSYADLGGCEVVCSNGSCSADPDPGETCYCSCNWLTSSANCRCTATEPKPQPTGPDEA